MPLQAEQWTNSALPRGALRSVYLEAQSENRSDVHVAKPEPVGRHAFIPDNRLHSPAADAVVLAPADPLQKSGP
jgi:hypothetical protein